MGILDFFKSKTVNVTSPSEHQAYVMQRNQHSISRKNISKGALKILYTLKNAGFSAYLVGGCVRDLLLEREPKDFDIVTDAHPEQIKPLFRSCYLVGRRFCIAHVRVGRDVYEVSTFRAKYDANNKQVQSTEQGLILLDNAYGDLEQDVWRRDFTANALYYNIADFTITDYTGGIADIQARVLRIIGDPWLRYREDPVRMLRAIRFAGKLGFTLEEKSLEPFVELRHLLNEVAPARLYLEAEKLLLTGHALATYELLLTHQMFEFLFPGSARCLQLADVATTTDQFLRQTLINTDMRLAENKYVTPAFLLAAFMWMPLQEILSDLRKRKRLNIYQALELAADQVLAEQLQNFSVPKRLVVRVREIWSLQLQLQKRNGKRPLRLLQHPRFRAAYDFLLLRAQVDPSLHELANWWTNFQEKNPVAKQAVKRHERKSRG